MGRVIKQTWANGGCGSFWRNDVHQRRCAIGEAYLTTGSSFCFTSQSFPTPPVVSWSLENFGCYFVSRNVCIVCKPIPAVSIETMFSRAPTLDGTGETHELRQELNSPNRDKKKDAVKKVRCRAVRNTKAGLELNRLVNPQSTLWTEIRCVRRRYISIRTFYTPAGVLVTAIADSTRLPVSGAVAHLHKTQPPGR